jgi:competence ComEA-like helix-hairpin-helix protein
MIWKSLLLKFCFLGCAVAFVVTLNLHSDPQKRIDHVFDAAVLQSDVHIKPLNPLVTTVGLYPSEHRPRSVNHHTESIQPFPSPVSTELRAADGIDVNNAGVDTLIQLPGIGVTLAQRIVDFRDTHGSFDDLTTLMRIKGIGPKRFAQIQPRLYLSTP